MFRDRNDAGRQLGRALARFRSDNPLVLALPRGGVPVAFEVAASLDAELDLLLVRKIGAPGHEELAVGAVVDGSHPQLVLNDDVMRLTEPPPGYIEAAQKRALAEIERRRRLYLGGAAPAAIESRVAIVVDDGVATGATMKAALRGVRRNKPGRLVLAVPVAPPSSVVELEAECDEIICLETPEPLYAVGLHYANFVQTTDDEVVRLLAKARERRGGASNQPASASPSTSSRSTRSG
ncbi:MAG TPA: phosphoribosyltransferase [Roseiarcus sp.]|nr:phosphoribosyltransferase [Roseiarcus sp.]